MNPSTKRSALALAMAGGIVVAGPAAASMAACTATEGSKAYTETIPAKIKHHATETGTVIVVDEPAVAAGVEVSHFEKVVDVEAKDAIPEVSHFEKVIDVPASPAVEEVSHFIKVIDVQGSPGVPAVTHDVKVVDVPAQAAVTHEEYKYIKQVRTVGRNGARGDWYTYKENGNDRASNWVQDSNPNKAGVQVPGLWSSGTYTLDEVGDHPIGEFRYHAFEQKTVTDKAAVVEQSHSETIIDTPAIPAVEEVSHFEKVIDVAAVPAVEEVSHQVKIIDIPGSPAIAEVSHEVKVIDTAATPAIPAVTHEEEKVFVEAYDEILTPAKVIKHAAVAPVTCTELPHTGANNDAAAWTAGSATFLVLVGVGGVTWARRRNG